MPRLPDTRPQVHATTDTPVHYGRPACIAQVHSVSGGRSIRWSLCASDEHGDGPAGVAVADLELLAGDLDAALAGDPSLHQDRALGDGQWTGRSWGSSAAWFGLTQRSSPTVPRPRRAGPRTPLELLSGGCRSSCLDRVGGQEACQVTAVCLPVPSVEADRVGVQVGQVSVVVDEEMVEQLLPVLEKGLPGVQIGADALDDSQAFVDRAVKDGQRELVEQVWGMARLSVTCPPVLSPVRGPVRGRLLRGGAGGPGRGGPAPAARPGPG
jgi:hypothetical protein